jgi:hypothetical protein
MGAILLLNKVFCVTNYSWTILIRSSDTYDGVDRPSERGTQALRKKAKTQVPTTNHYK